VTETRSCTDPGAATANDGSCTWTLRMLPRVTPRPSAPACAIVFRLVGGLLDRLSDGRGVKLWRPGGRARRPIRIGGTRGERCLDRGLDLVRADSGHLQVFGDVVRLRRRSAARERIAVDREHRRVRDLNVGRRHADFPQRQPHGRHFLGDRPNCGIAIGPGKPLRDVQREKCQGTGRLRNRQIRHPRGEQCLRRPRRGRRHAHLWQQHLRRLRRRAVRGHERRHHHHCTQTAQNKPQDDPAYPT